MIYEAEYIEQPYSGEYDEKIYDIESPWNSGDWTWIKFSEEGKVWCGEFRGKYRDVAFSEKLGIVVVLTSDYMYVLDIYTAEIMEYYSQPQYVEMTTSPFEDILITDGYGIEMFKNSKIEDLEPIVLPIQPDNLRFVEWIGNTLKITCYEFLIWGKEIELYLDVLSMEWLDYTSKLLIDKDYQRNTEIFFDV